MLPPRHLQLATDFSHRPTFLIGAVATKAADTLHDNIMEESTGRQSHELGDAIRAAFTRTDSECCESAAPEECCVGAVCCSAVLTADQRLWIGAYRDQEQSALAAYAPNVQLRATASHVTNH